MGHLDTAVEFFTGTKGASFKPFDPQHPNHKGKLHRLAFEIRDPKSNKEVDSVELHLMPEAYQRVPTTRLAVHPTAGGYHVDMPAISARGLIQYSIRGTSGVMVPIPDGRGGVSEYREGMQEIQRLRALFARYLRGDDGSFKINGRPRSEFELWFINPDEPIDGDGNSEMEYLIVPSQRAVVTSRSNRLRGVWLYNINFVAIASEVEKRKPAKKKSNKKGLFDIIDDALGYLDLVSFDRVMAAYRSLLSPFARLRGTLQRIRRFLEAWRAGAATFYHLPMGMVQGAIIDLTAITSTIWSVTGISAYSAYTEVTEDLREISEMRLALSRTHNAMLTNAPLGPPMSSAAGRLATSLENDGFNLRTALQRNNTARRLGPADRRDSRQRRAGQGLPFGTTLAPVAFGDTFEDFIPTGYTDIDLLDLNPDLVWPFVDGGRVRPDGNTDKVKFIGELVRVPTEAAREQEVAQSDAPVQEAQRGSVSEEARLFGVDLQASPDGSGLAFDPKLGDLVVVSGTDNLVARLRRALLLRRGSLRAAPEAGTDLLDATWSSATRQRRLMAQVRRVLTDDPGVARVRRLNVGQVNGQTNVDFEVDTVSGTPLGSAALGA